MKVYAVLYRNDLLQFITVRVFSTEALAKAWAENTNCDGMADYWAISAQEIDKLESESKHSGLRLKK